MREFTLKIRKNIWKMEICDYSYSAENEKYLKITQYCLGRYVHEETIDLTTLVPEFYEMDDRRAPRGKLIFSCFAAGVFCFIGLLLMFSLFLKMNDVPATVFSLIISSLVAYYFIDDAIKKSKEESFSKFMFSDENQSSGVTIPYKKGKRAETYAFVCEIARHCNQDLVPENCREVVRHRFANGMGELRDRELVILNEKGVKKESCNYAWVIPGTHHYVERHILLNLFCIFLSVVFLGGSLTLVILGAIATRDWVATIAGFGFLGLIPFSLGCYFFFKQKKSRNYYIAGSRFDGDAGIYLEVGKKPGSEKAFIDELNDRLRQAYRESENNGIG